MLRTTLGQILTNEALPPDLRDYTRVLDKKGVSKLFSEVANKYPDEYKNIAKQLSDIGRDASYTSGGQSFGLSHLRPTLATLQSRERLNKRISFILNNPELSAKAREEAIVSAAGEEHERLSKEIMAEGKESGSPLADQVVSGSRGNPATLKRLVGGDLLYVDHRENVIPFPVQRSFSEGLRPAEFWASSYGARKGIVDVKVGTQDGGFASKQLSQLTHRLMVTDVDGPEDTTGNIRGLPMDVTDMDSAGALLAHPVAGYKRNTELTPKILKDIEAQGYKRILVRSPTVGGPDSGGVYARDVGIREKGRIAPLGDMVGIAAANALAERMTQGQLCLAEGTLVRMADNTDKPIEQVVENELVLGADAVGNTFPVKVLYTYNNGNKECVRTVFSFDNNKRVELVCTEDHKVLTRSGIAPISSVFDCVTVDKDSVSRKEQWPVGSLPTYDLEVDHPDHLFVLANGLIVSNSSKHSGGVKGESKAVFGFPLINQFIQVPKTFKSGAAHAQVDGKVTDITEAPAGGMYITIGNERHYVAPDFELKVKKGDFVEAGDVLSNGVPNPAELVKHKGIGEGRRYFTDIFTKAFRDSGMPAHRRNVELVARGLINHVEMVDPDEHHIPGDVIPYQALEATWEPRKGFQTVTPNSSVGKYLERPVLHYTIGTKVKPSMIPVMQEFGVKQVDVHDDPPPFQPYMVRAMASVGHDPDWMVQFLGSNQKKNLLNSVYTGAVSDTRSSSFVPSMAEGTGFGSNWPASILKPAKS